MTGSRVKDTQVNLRQAAIPILGLLLSILYGLILRPHLFHQQAIPLEIVFIIAAIIAISHLSILGFSWEEIQDSIVTKLSKGMPMILILFAIGLIIGSWIICGTIPMLVYYGIKYIDPAYLYTLAFIVPAIFSSFTGTSWGSVGTIGIVVIGIAMAVNGHLGITAGGDYRRSVFLVINCLLYPTPQILLLLLPR